MPGDLEILKKEYLLVSDFDQTLSFNDSGIVLSELLGIAGFADRISGLSKIHLGVATLERRSMQPDIGGFGPVRCGIASNDQNRLTDRWRGVAR